jgi:hypothetical protein
MRNVRSALFFSALLLAGAVSNTTAMAAAPQLQPTGSLPGSSGALFGYSVAIDGATAVVGAIEDHGGTGAAYVYTFSGGSWSSPQPLTVQDGAAGDQFGYTVAVSGDTALVSAAGKGNGQGYVYSFTRSGSQWTLQDEFTEPAGGANDCFGCALALTQNAGQSTAVIGAAGAAGGVGRAYVFTGSDGTWAPQASFVGLSQFDYFGYSVALDPTGSLAVIGAFGVNDNTGAAYVTNRSGTSWTQSQPALTATDGAPGDQFGYAVATNGASVLVGAAVAGGSGAGYFFGPSGAAWSQTQKITSPNPSGSDYFGGSLAMTANIAVVGAYERNGGAGAAYAYDVVGTGVGLPAQVLTASGGGQQFFALNVAASTTNVAIGAFGASNQAGAAYFYAAGTTTTNAPALGRGFGLPLLMSLLGVFGIMASAKRRGEHPS